MILVTGATGTVGSEVVHLLCDAGHPTRALVRSPERADSLRGLDCEVAIGDFGDADSLHHALHDVSAVFLMSPIGPDQAEQESAVVDAAERAGGPAVVKLAAIGWDGGRLGRIGEQHRRVVQRLAASGLSYTVLAPNDFFQNLLGQAATVQECATLAAPAGEAAVSSVDARDVAAVAAHVLASGGHEGRSYTITGAQSLTWAERAVALSRVLGTEVSYVDLPPERARDRWLQTMPEWHADALLELYTAYRDGVAAMVTDEVRQATGRGPRVLDDFLAEHRAAFASS